MTTNELSYARLEGTIALEGPVWHAGEAASVGTLLDVPEHLLGGPVGVFRQGTLVAAVGRSMDFQPFSVVAREDVASEIGATGVTIRGAANLTIRAETNPASAGFMGHLARPETDFLILEAQTGFLVRLA